MLWFQNTAGGRVIDDLLKYKPFSKGYILWVHYGESIGETSTISPSSVSNTIQDIVVIDDHI